MYVLRGRITFPHDFIVFIDVGMNERIRNAEGRLGQGHCSSHDRCLLCEAHERAEGHKATEMEIDGELASELASVGERAFVVGGGQQPDVEEMSQCTFHLRGGGSGREG